jgi:hypothetical protein
MLGPPIYPDAPLAARKEESCEDILGEFVRKERGRALENDMIRVDKILSGLSWKS